MRIRGSLEAGDDVLHNVTLWSDAAREVTHLDAETLSGLWELCDSIDGKTAFLQALNAHIQHTYLFNCSLRVWRRGGNAGYFEAQVNVNDAELHVQ